MARIRVIWQRALFMKRYISLLIFSLLWMLQISNAQSTGYINRQATSAGGRTILDPNGDGYTSTNSSGFAGNDVANSELPFRSVPSYSIEPYGDLRRGPSHLYSDFVPDGNNVGYYTYYDGTNLLFRFRVGSIMQGSKGYSVLLDTDGKFGSSGANADPNYQAATTGTNGNPGFEIEIVLETNSRIAIYNVDGSSTPTLVTSYSNWQDMSQISVAGTFDNGDPDFFIDFYVPFSALTSSPFNLTSSSSLRMAATTVMSPQAAIGGPKSDIYGTNDASFKTTNEQYEAFITSQPGFTPGGLTSGGLSSMCTAPPTVTAPLSTGTVSVSGTWTSSTLSGAASTTTITVYKNGVSVGTVSNVSSGSTWTLAGVSLANGDIVTAKAQAAGESMCLVSNSVTARSCTTATRPPIPTLTCAGNYSKGVTGSNLSTGWTIYVENQTRGTTETSVANPGQFTTSGTSPNITWNYAGGCNGGPNMPSGSYRIYYVNASGCASEPISFCLATGSGAANNLAGTSATPTITSPGSLTPGTSSLSGTGEANSTVRLYVDGEMVQSTTASGTGTFSFTNLSLTLGQSVYITNVLNTGTVNTSKCFAASTTYTVNCYTTPPLINVDNNNQLTAGAAITGTSSEPAGTTIRVYTSAAVLVATVTVQSDKTWTTGSYTAVAGTSYYATAQNGTCTVSSASSTFAAATATTGRCGSITGTITTSSSSISGILATAVASTTVNLYLDGTKIGTVVTSTTSFTISTFTYPLYNGGILSIGVQETGKLEQVCGTTTTVSCSSGPATPTISPTSSSLAAGQTQTFTISNATVGAFYGIADASTGQSLGTGVWASATSLNITTNTFTSGNYTVQIKGTSLSGLSMCSSSGSSASLIVTSSLPSKLGSFTGVWINNTVRLNWKTVMESELDKFEIERSTDAITYQSLGNVKALNALNGSTYSFLDASPKTINYYRLKQIDLDGRATYSNVLVMKLGTLSKMMMYPNPFTNQLSIQLYLTKTETIQLDLLDIRGVRLASKQVMGVFGNNTINWEGLGHINQGVYMLRIKTSHDSTTLHQKLIKTN